jgi:uncharacterized repeat protein (TIGR03809 family)
MSAAFFQTSIESVRRWHALAERRRNYIVELYRSDRWRRYYSEDAFRTLMREVIQNAETWGKVLEDMNGVAPPRATNGVASTKAANGAAPAKAVNGAAPAKAANGAAPATATNGATPAAATNGAAPARAVVAPVRPIGGVAVRAA